MTNLFPDIIQQQQITGKLLTAFRTFLNFAWSWKQSNPNPNSLLLEVCKPEESWGRRETKTRTKDKHKTRGVDKSGVWASRTSRVHVWIIRFKIVVDKNGEQSEKYNQFFPPLTRPPSRSRHYTWIRYFPEPLLTRIHRAAYHAPRRTPPS